MSDAHIGIDIGTSSIKAVTVVPGFGVVAEARASTPWRTFDGLTECDPFEIEAVVVEVLEQAADVSARIASIGITGFAESGVALDADGTPLAPIVAWHDPRGASQLEQLVSWLGPGEFERRTGLSKLDPRFSIIKLRWLADHGRLDRPVDSWLTVPEWIIHRLGGSRLSDLSHWSRTGLLSIDRPEFDADLMGWAGVPIDAHAPTWSGADGGEVTRSRSRLAGARLTTAGHDHSTAAVGAGVLTPGELFDSWGNGEMLIRSLDAAAKPDIAAAGSIGANLGWHVLADRRALLLGLGTGLVLNGVLADLVISPEARQRLDLALDDTTDPTAVAWRAALSDAFAIVQSGVERVGSITGPVERVVGTGGWLRSAPVRELKQWSVPGFAPATVDEAGAVGAAAMGAWSLEPASSDQLAFLARWHEDNASFT